MRATATAMRPHGSRFGPSVLIVAPEPFYEDRGTPIAVGQLAAALVKLEYRTELITYPIGDDVMLPGLRILRSTNVPGLRHVPIGFSLRKVVLDLLMLPMLWRKLRPDAYLIVHALEEMALPVIWLCRHRGIPVIYDMQSCIPDQLHRHWLFGTKPAQRLLRSIERWMLVNANAVICSAGLGNHVQRVAPASRATEWMFAGQLRSDGRDSAEALRDDLGIARDAPVALYTGTFEAYQGLDLLIDAIPAVVAAVPETVFVLVGAMDDELGRVPAVSSLIEAGRIVVVPRQPRRLIPAYLMIADVLVSPRAYGDNVPLKIFDYMLSGKPIVATDIPAHRSLLSEHTAMLVPRVATDLADAIVRVLREPDLGEALSSTALLEAGRYPGGESFVGLVRRLYEETLRRNGARPARGQSRA